MVKRSYARSNSSSRVSKRRTMPMRSRPKSHSTKVELERLSRLVTKNTKLSQGALQRNCQTLNEALLIGEYCPACFQADNFLSVDTNTPLSTSNSCTVYRPGIDTVSGEAEAPEVVGYFTRSVVNAIKTTGYTTAAGDDYPSSYWLSANGDIPDSGKYTALYADYRFSVFPIQGDPVYTRFRIDFVRLKKPLPSPLVGVGPFNGQIGTQQLLPGTIAALGGLMSVNMYNPDYFSVIDTKEFFLDAPHYRTAQEFTCTVHLDLGGKTVNQGETTNNFNAANSDPLKNVWCIISTSQSQDDLITPNHALYKINIARQCVWRDPLGSATQ
jgi:hypothetical protein